MLILNAWHIYVMFEWSDRWADGSDLLLLGTGIHIIESFASVYTVYNDSRYFYQLKDLRLLSILQAYIFMTLWILGIFLEIYLVFFSNSLIGFIVSLYIAYILIISLTMVPQTLVIIVYEASLNVLDRDPNWSTPGFYFSFYEFACEQLGLYGNDMRLTNWLIT